MENIRKKKEKKLESKINSITSIPDEKTRINFDYAKQDLERANENRFKLLIKFDLLDQQLAKEYNIDNQNRIL